MSSAIILGEAATTKRRRGIIGGTLALALLAGCDDTGNFAMPSFGQDATTPETTTQASGGKTVERDVEAPEVFAVTDEGLWDGRPSLGGVWVAHPDVGDPERVIIRNEANGKFVVGALFRREREIPGPKLQISSDAAASLGILAGSPAPLNVTALRREETQVPSEAEPADEASVETAAIAAPADVTAAPLDPIESASAAIDAAEPAAVAAAAPQPAPKASSLAKPFVQIGIFSVEANATRAAKQIRSAGLSPTVKRQETNGKPFWRVLVGPAANSGELKSNLSAIKAEGFTDAYAVTN
ncbi:SPOR domain-containing protein [Sulfitobacter sp. SK012]|uniref:SPOR domain-containing protein n=1 Tax=Sulfitobacter sp. SK012 TaxID=1389005 RepID=UPI0020C756A9|nr:SPOR domain-containing protein [Sulfitobacter sp. SK012]